jgi:6,7-dimethyl-8-ribityllumazine synthase
MDAGLASGVPVIFGVLTVETQAQAEERAAPTRMNKGGESMEAALEMIELLAPFVPPGGARARAPARTKAVAKKPGRRPRGR